jgi:hypothetical protein
MPKPMYVWSGSAWVSVASEVESLAGFATQSYADNTPGMKLVVPTSVAVGSGSGSVGTSGVVTFSAASSVSLNGCFSSSYQNYKIVINYSGTVSDYLYFRTRASGTDLSSSIYGRTVIIMDSAIGYLSSASQSAGWSGNTTANFDGGSEVNVYSPFESAVTRVFASGTNKRASNTSAVFMHGNIIDNTTSYDGITFYPSSGTVTGTIRVYGMKN